MDEIGWLKQFKKGLKFFNIFILGYVMIGVISSVIKYLNDKDTAFLFEYVGVMFLILLITNIFSILIYSTIYLIYKLTYVKFNVDFNKEYIRELYAYYPPAIVSLIYDLKTEVYRDYTATILELYIKKHIKISGFKEDIVIDKGKNEELSNLLKHELYVYNCIINKENLDADLLKNYILEDAKERELLIEGEKNIKNQKIFLIGLILIIISLMLLNISGNFLWRMIISILISIIISATWVLPYMFSELVKLDENYKITSKGKQELKKNKSIQKFYKRLYTN